MLISDIVTADFETDAIGPRPNEYPPRPVGLAFRWQDGSTEYMAWGHPSGNNCTFEEARRAWFRAIRFPVLYQNGAFDIEVAMKHFDSPWPPVWHDTLFLMFLENPHASTYALKPAAKRILGIAPTEQQDLNDWIIANVPGATKRNAGAHISKAPASLVAPYAIGDVDRTFLIFEKLYPEIERTMLGAYQRELDLCPFLVDAERRGIRADRTKLTAWAEQLEPAIVRCDTLIRDRLGAPVLSVDSDEELIEALDQAGVMRGWENAEGELLGSGSPDEPVVNPFADPSVSVEPRTPDRPSVSKGAMKRQCTDPELVATLLYRNTAATMLRTFVLPWLDLSAADGRLHTKWHQVRGQERNGTRTGRIASADPNLANVPNPQDKVKPPLGCPFLPALRGALLPEEGHVWVSADYSQQELRWAAHFEGAAMMRAYQADPRLDLHDHAKMLIKQQTGLDIDRKLVKTVAFATIYGAGLKQLSAQMGVPESEAWAVREAYFTALPGLRILSREAQGRARAMGFVRSGGGRLIKLETPRVDKRGIMRTFEYKTLNHLIQGTSAEQTKQAIIDFCRSGSPGLFLGQVYDEVNVSVPASGMAQAANTLAACMQNALAADVLFTTDVEVGLTWGSLHEVKPGSDTLKVLQEIGYVL